MAYEHDLDAEALLKRIGQYHRTGPLSFEALALDYLNLSFSLSGEDLILRKKVHGKLLSGKAGCYVDVGSFHPFLASNTYLFYCFGWSGLCIDANPIFKTGFEDLRPRDTFVHAAITQTSQEVNFAEHKENTGMSRIFEVGEEIPDAFGPPTQVPTARLDTVLESRFQSGQVIDIMSVDVEEMDLDVLKSNDWTRFRPQYLCVEDHSTDVMNPADIWGNVYDFGA